jgi:hypothetical protein
MSIHGPGQRPEGFHSGSLRWPTRMKDSSAALPVAALAARTAAGGSGLSVMLAAGRGYSESTAVDARIRNWGVLPDSMFFSREYRGSGKPPGGPAGPGGAP